MKRICAQILFFAMIFCFLAAPLNGNAAAMQVASGGSADGMIRVWLSSIRSNTTYNLTLNGAYTLGNQMLSSGSKVKVEFSGGTVYVTSNGARSAMGASATLVRQSGGLRIAEALSPANEYPGDFRFFYSGGTAYVVCSLFIEDYLYGVLPYEMSNSFPLEALRAQAVAARTFAAFSKKSGGSYDVTDTVSYQVFRGVSSSNTRCIQAVNDTKGLVLKYGGAYIEASFGASNGGQTETRYNAWGSSRVAYQQIKDDPYDLANTASTVRSYMIYSSPSKGSSTSAYTMIQEAIARQKGGSSANYAITEITDVSLHTPKYAAPSRVYTQMSVSAVYNGGESTIVSIPVFTTVKPTLGLKINGTNNELFSVTREATGFRVAARRYGHGIGLSQRGAQQMANSGMGYAEILGFYYEGAQLTQVAFTSSSLSGGSNPVPAPTTEAPVITGETSATVSLASPNDYLNLRQQPSTSARVIGALPNGASVTITGTEGSWYAVRYGGLNGYVASQYLSVSQGEESTGNTGQQEGTNAVVTVQTGMLNLRSGESTATAILGLIPNGARLTVLQQGDVWSFVRYGSLTGYVMTQFLTMTGEVGATPTDGPTIEPTATPTPTATTGTEAGHKAIVTLARITETLNLRMGPSMSTPVLTLLRHGMELDVLARDTEWTKVSYNGITGYVMNTFITFRDGASPTPETTIAPETTLSPDSTPATGVKRGAVTVRAGMLNLRSRPSTAAPIVANIPNHTVVTIINMNDVWCSVRYGALEGFVMRAYLTIEGGGAEQAVQGEATAQPTAGVAAKEGAIGIVMVNPGTTLNLRSRPTMGAEVLAEIPNRTELKVLNMNNVWCSVRYGEIDGFVMRAYLALDGEVVDDQSAKLASASEPSATASPEATAGITSTAYVSTDNGKGVNIRAAESLESEVLGTADNGAAVEVVAAGNEWFRVRHDDVTGYIASMYLVETTPAEATSTPIPEATSAGEQERPTSGAVAYVKTLGNSVNLRQAPSTAAGILASVFHGEQVEKLGTDGDWTRVRYDGTEGYIASDYITDTAPTATSAPTKNAINMAVARPYMADEAINLRSEPNEYAEITGVILDGTDVEVLEYAGIDAQWLYVRNGSLAGYAQREEFDLANRIAFVTLQDGGSINLRAAQGDDAEVIGAVQDGAAVTVLGSDTSWAKIRLANGTIGFVSASYLEYVNG